MGYDPIYVINTSSNKSITAWENPLHAPSGLATILELAQLSADGKLLVASSNRQAVALFDVPSRTLIGTLDVANIHDLSLSEDGKRLITVSDVGVLLWNLDPSAWESKALEIANPSLNNNSHQK
jgi:WD40 repeat protein